MQNDMTTTT